jgi:hypothetical protein
MSLIKNKSLNALSTFEYRDSKGALFVRSFNPRVFAVMLLAGVLLSAWNMEAKNGPGSVSTTVLNAKTIYVENRTTDARLQNAVYTELMKWGRFQITDSPQKADLILRISNGNMVRFVSGEATNTPSTATKEAPPIADETVPPGYTRLTVVDSKTGNAAWSGQMKTSGAPAGWHLLDSLREAIEKSRNTK